MRGLKPTAFRLDAGELFLKRGSFGFEPEELWLKAGKHRDIDGGRLDCKDVDPPEAGGRLEEQEGVADVGSWTVKVLGHGEAGL